MRPSHRFGLALQAESRVHGQYTLVPLGDGGRARRSLAATWYKLDFLGALFPHIAPGVRLGNLSNMRTPLLLPARSSILKLFHLEVRLTLVR